MRNSSTFFQSRALLFAVLVHCILLVLLWWGAAWQTPRPTEVELWDATSLAGNAIEPNAAATVAVNKTAPVVVQTPHASVKMADPAEIESAVKPTQAANKPVVSEPKKPATAVPPKPAPSQAAPVKTDNRNSVLGSITGKSTTATNTDGATGKANNGNAQAYIGRLQRAIEKSGNDRGLSGLRGSITVKVSPNGGVSVQGISGLPSDKAAILRQAANLSVSGPPAEVIGRSIPLKLVFR